MFGFKSETTFFFLDGVPGKGTMKHFVSCPCRARGGPTGRPEVAVIATDQSRQAASERNATHMGRPPGRPAAAELLASTS